MLDLVGVRFHRTSRSLRSIWEISEKLDVRIISGCFLSQRTLNIWQWASESCICHLSPFTRRRIMVSQKQFRLVARPNSCKRHFVHPNPLQTSLKHPYKPHMILGCTIFFFRRRIPYYFMLHPLSPSPDQQKTHEIKVPGCHARRQAWRQEKVQNLRFSAADSDNTL